MALAAPDIDSVTGTFINGQTIMIAGSGFGTKTAAPLISSYDNATATNNFSSGSNTDEIDSLGGSWATTQGDVILSSASPRASITQSNLKASYVPRTDSGSDYHHVGYNQSSATDTYVSFWMYRDYAAYGLGNNTNEKFYRVWTDSNSPYYPSPVWTVQNTGGTYATISGGDGNAGDLTWNGTLAYNTVSAGQYGGGSYSPTTATLLPLQQWHHIEYFIHWNTSTGNTDGYSIFIVDGKTWWRATNVCFFGNEADGNDVRWHRIGQVTGSAPSGNEYLDQLYIDSTQAHIIISNTDDLTWPDYGSASHTEIQVPATWNDTGITFTLNQGSFEDDDTVYLYVVNASGEISPAYTMDLGTDEVAPAFSSASIPVGGTTTVVTFSEAVTNVSVDVGDFNLDCSTAGDGVDLTYSSGSGTSQWTFLNENQIYSGDTCTLDIVTSAGEAADASSNDLTAEDDKTVTNNSSASLTAAGSISGLGSGSGGSVTGLGAGNGGRFN